MIMDTKIKAVVLAAGKGMRFRPLTNNRPKPLLKTLDRAILDHNLNQLNGLVDEIVLVIGYLGETIKNTFGSSYKGIKIHYIEQNSPMGTGDAARMALPRIKDKFLLLNGDDLYDKNDIKKVLAQFPSVLLAETKNHSNFGVIDLNNDLVRGIVEKPKKSASQLVNAGLYFLPKKVFDYKIKLSPRGEYEFTDYINKFVEKEKLYWVKAGRWCPLSYPWNLFDANEFLLAEGKKALEGRIEQNCRLGGKIIVQKGAVVKAGSYFEGPIYIGRNAIVGPNCYLKGPLSIGANAVVGHGAVIERSIIGDRSQVARLSYVADSVIGSDCDLAAGTTIANYRFDGATIKVATNGKVVDTKLTRFGCIMGDDAKTGVNSSIMPGVIIGNGAVIGPHSIAMENVPDKAVLFSKTESVIKKKINDARKG